MNPIILFDNFFSGNRRRYQWPTKLAIAKEAGFDGFEFVLVDLSSDDWKGVQDLLPDYGFTQIGFHYTTRAVIDREAPQIDAEIERISERLSQIASFGYTSYLTLSLSGTDELGGPTVHERGSAKAEDRHWERASKIIAALDKASQETGVPAFLYPHINWLCDTPQSLIKILRDSGSKKVGASFCSHHWYGNKASVELDEVFQLPLMSERLGYAVLTNGQFTDKGFRAVRLDEGEIDIPYVLAHLWENGYTGPIASQGLGIGGDPLIAAKRVVDYLKSLEKRFEKNPQLNPARS